MLQSCEHCDPEARIPFDWILDRVTRPQRIDDRLHSRSRGEVPELQTRNLREDGDRPIGCLTVTQLSPPNPVLYPPRRDRRALRPRVTPVQTRRTAYSSTRLRPYRLR